MHNPDRQRQPPAAPEPNHAPCSPPAQKYAIRRLSIHGTAGARRTTGSDVLILDAAIRNRAAQPIFRYQNTHITAPSVDPIKGHRQFAEGQKSPKRTGHPPPQNRQYSLSKNFIPCRLGGSFRISHISVDLSGLPWVGDKDFSDHLMLPLPLPGYPTSSQVIGNNIVG